MKYVVCFICLISGSALYKLFTSQDWSAVADHAYWQGTTLLIYALIWGRRGN